MDNNIISCLRKFISDHCDRGAVHLSTGRAKNYEDYQRLVGRIEGLQLVEIELQDLIERNDKND